MAERVVIAIPTCKRPKSLARLLNAVAELKTDADISVLVADNDADGASGFRSLRAPGASYRWPLRAVIEAERGIAQVRNRLVAEALKSDAQFIAMIDDDEWPEPNWIARISQGAARHRRRCAARLHPVHAHEGRRPTGARHPPCHRSRSTCRKARAIF